MVCERKATLIAPRVLASQWPHAFKFRVALLTMPRH